MNENKSKIVDVFSFTDDIIRDYLGRPYYSCTQDIKDMLREAPPVDVFYVLMLEDSWYNSLQILAIFSNKEKANEYKEKWLRTHKRDSKYVRLFVTEVDVDPEFKEAL